MEKIELKLKPTGKMKRHHIKVTSDIIDFSNASLKMIHGHVSIIKGNVKLGTIPYVSLPPITTCRCKAPCIRQCYALKPYACKADAYNSRQKNLYSYRVNAVNYFNAIDRWLEIKKPDFFRWHSAGDIVDLAYFKGIISIAKKHPDIKFLCFTKKYEIVNQYRGIIPSNLSVVFSMWVGLDMPKNRHSLPYAFVDDGMYNFDYFIVHCGIDKAIECSGNCTNCAMCWNLKKIGFNVVFKLH